ncbi:hypothetical protein LPJ70_007318, partial [Coemansia sp. RSA 2708]
LRARRPAERCADADLGAAQPRAGAADAGAVGARPARQHRARGRRGARLHPRRALGRQPAGGVRARVQSGGPGRHHQRAAGAGGGRAVRGQAGLPERGGQLHCQAAQNGRADRGGQRVAAGPVDAAAARARRGQLAAVAVPRPGAPVLPPRAVPAGRRRLGDLPRAGLCVRAPAGVPRRAAAHGRRVPAAGAVAQHPAL